MAERLLPRNLPEMFAYALAMERDATKRFAELERYMREAGLDHIADEFESIGREEREQYELLALGTQGRNLPEIQEWEYAWHYLGPQQNWKPRPPRSAREALMLALASERRTENFYADVAEHVADDAVSAFAAEMAADERRHVNRLELLLRREPESVFVEDEDASVGAAEKP